MELITDVQIGLDSRFIFIGSDGGKIYDKKVIGKSLYVGDHGALLQELRKEKARKQYLIDLFGRVEPISDESIDAAISKSENAVMNGCLSAQAPCASMYSEWTDEAKGRLKSALGDVFGWKSK